MNTSEVADVLDRFLPEDGRVLEGRVFRWNDYEDDDGEVIDHMRRCAKELRKQ